MARGAEGEEGGARIHAKEFEGEEVLSGGVSFNNSILLLGTSDLGCPYD